MWDLFLWLGVCLVFIVFVFYHLERNFYEIILFGCIEKNFKIFLFHVC